MNILVCAAHPDDEVLGAGGTLAKHQENGGAAIAFFGRGIREGESYPQLDVAQQLWRPGVISFHMTPDQEFERIPIRYLADFAADWIKGFFPNILITHSLSDLNRDHQIAAEATMIACRRSRTSLILGCQGDRDMRPFIPNYFVDITEQWSAKVKMLEAYRDFLLPYPDPRSIEGQEARARYWGTVAGCEYAEAFELVRRVEH